MIVQLEMATEIDKGLFTSRAGFGVCFFMFRLSVMLCYFYSCH